MTTQVTTEDVKSIDIRWLRKNGYLDRRGSSSIHWHSNGERTGSIRCLMSDSHMTLVYCAGEESFSYDVMFDKTACHLGGYRKWFECPTCFRRCGLLYLSDLRFACRKCARLPYLSTLQSDISRMIEQKHKLGYRTFEGYDGDGYWKKKHMQQKTFEKLRDRYEELDQRIDKVIYRYLSKYS